MAETPGERKPSPDRAVGERAFEEQVERVAWGLVISDDHPATRTNAGLIARANGLAASGDFVGAIKVLGEVEIHIRERAQEAVRAEDVEEALAGLRRAIARAPEGPARRAAFELLTAARAAASDGRWDAAWALVAEADERLGSAYSAGAV